MSIKDDLLLALDGANKKLKQKVDNIKNKYLELNRQKQDEEDKSKIENLKKQIDNLS